MPPTLPRWGDFYGRDRSNDDLKNSTAGEPMSRRTMGHTNLDESLLTSSPGPRGGDAIPRLSDRPRWCGCRATPRRRCDRCAPEEPPFLTCGARCLQVHLDSQHPGAGDARTRALAFQGEVNRLGLASRTIYAGHRARLSRLLCAAQRAEGLCVLGAGNGHDLDLPVLVRVFGEVHLVDIDGEALARAIADLPPPLGSRVTVHADLDLSGCLDRIDAWGDVLPDEGALRAHAAATATAIARRVGRTFDVVLSACVLSQLVHPLQNSLALGPDGWDRLFSMTRRLHLDTATHLVRPGGTGVLACDVLCQAGHEVEQIRRRVPPNRLGDALLRAVENRTIRPDPDPAMLAQLLESAAFSSLVDSVFVTDPWHWDLGTASQVVYAVLFRRG
jgi:hypothetical protein